MCGCVCMCVYTHVSPSPQCLGDKLGSSHLAFYKGPREQSQVHMPVQHALYPLSRLLRTPVSLSSKIKTCLKVLCGLQSNHNRIVEYRDWMTVWTDRLNWQTGWTRLFLGTFSTRGRAWQPPSAQHALGHGQQAAGTSLAPKGLHRSQLMKQL